jgi:hypothetical protein
LANQKTRESSSEATAGYEDPLGVYVEDQDYSRKIPFSLGDVSPRPNSVHRQLYDPYEAKSVATKTQRPSPPHGSPRLSRDTQPTFSILEVD